MRQVSPEVFLIASTSICDLEGYLASISHEDWHTDSESDADVLVEAAGRLCYRSWAVFNPSNPEGTNPNVTRIRSGNQKYVQNLIESMHGSVLEHANLTFMFKNVSRVFTHELVRHRAGMAYSQESLRYVLLTDLGFWIPPAVREIPEMYDLYVETVQHLEAVQRQLHSMVKLDEMGFNEKKKWTSRFRRLAPIGLATNIMATGNLRSWRHIFTMRSASGAEEEIQMVQDLLAPIFVEVAPSVFSDLHETSEGWRFDGEPRRGV